METSLKSDKGTAGAVFDQLDAPDEMFAAARAGDMPGPLLRVNAHVHLPPNFSAFDTVAQAVQLAADEGIAVLGASNYYDYGVYVDFADEAARCGIVPLFGLEIIALIGELVRDGTKINDPGNPGKMYICGKGIGRFDPMTSEGAELLDVIRTRDSVRMARMTDRLAEIFTAAGLNTGLDEDTVKDQVVRRHGSRKETVFLQERHVAQAFQEALFERVPVASRGALLQRLFGANSKADPDDAAAIQNQIRSHLMKAGKPAYIEETFVGLEHAYRLVLALGGIPCYPTLADGASPICPFEQPVEKLIEEITGRGIYCAELIPVRNTPGELSRYVKAMRAAGLIVTAGTEHNTREMLPLEPTCLGGQPIPQEIREIFWEGACVVAAHQYLVLRGAPGFVLDDGQPNPAYPSADHRITAFRQLGEAVIRQYQERVGGAARPG